MSNWGYLKSNGPNTWAHDFPDALGHEQSPIDIEPGKALYDQTLRSCPLKMSYKAENAQKLFNNGHSVQMVYSSDGSALDGGPLSDKYKIAQFHFHWGKCDESGSEHTVDGKMFAGEAHIVHYNADKYADFASAASQPDGLCVLGVFIKVGKENAGLKKITDQLHNIEYSGESVHLDGGFDPACILPHDKSKFWTYPGSLTTPPCYESVTWILFKECLELSEDQLLHLRGLKTYVRHASTAGGDAAPSDDDEHNGCMIDNYRPPQPIYRRTLRASFDENVKG